MHWSWGNLHPPQDQEPGNEEASKKGSFPSLSRLPRDLPNPSLVLVCYHRTLALP